MSNAARRGVDVPPELEEQWKALKRKRVSNEEAAAMLGLKRQIPKKAKHKRPQAPSRWPGAPLRG